MRNIRAFLRRAATIVAASTALAFGAAGNAQAGCGTIWTFNMTDHWMWVTIYSLGHAFHYDWGWVAPHNGRAWHAGGAPTPMSYMCGSFYHVRAEVKSTTDPKSSNPDSPNIFDTETEINPQLKNWLEMIGGVVKMGLTCAEGEGVTCAVKWGLEKGFDMAVFGAESSGGIVCLTTHDNKNFGWVDNDSCGDPKAKPKPTSVTISVNLGGNRFAVAPKQNRIWLLVDGKPPTPDVLRLGKWSTTTPKVVKVEGGAFQVIGHGTGVVVYTYGGKSASASFQAP